jgi:hypothetical protein
MIEAIREDGLFVVSSTGHSPRTFAMLSPLARHYGHLRIDNRRNGAIFSSQAIYRFLRGRVAVGRLLLDSPLIGLVE